jgi:hypothetical protein
MAKSDIIEAKNVIIIDNKCNIIIDSNYIFNIEKVKKKEYSNFIGHWVKYKGEVIDRPYMFCLGLITYDKTKYAKEKDDIIAMVLYILKDKLQ